MHLPPFPPLPTQKKVPGHRVIGSKPYVVRLVYHSRLVKLRCHHTYASSDIIVHVEMETNFLPGTCKRLSKLCRNILNRWKSFLYMWRYDSSIWAALYCPLSIKPFLRNLIASKILDLHNHWSTAVALVFPRLVALVFPLSCFMVSLAFYSFSLLHLVNMM